MTARSQRTVGLGHQVAAVVLLDQLLAIAERVEVDLVDDGCCGRDGLYLLQLGDAEVRPPDRARLAKGSRPFHPGPGPRRSALGPVHKVEIDVLGPQAIQTRLELCDRIAGPRAELRGDEHVAAVEPALSKACSDACLVPIRLGRVDVAVAKFKCPADRLLALTTVWGLPHAE